jgi:hypothetical protein
LSEPAWDDNRLRAAFAEQFAVRAPEDLRARTVDAIRTGPRAHRRGWSFPTWAPVAAAVLVVAGVFASRLPGYLATTAAPDARGLAVLTITEALEIHATGSDRPIAVRGYYSPAPPVPCPARLSAALNPVRLDCPRDHGWVLDTPEPLSTISSTLPDGRIGFNPVFPGLDASGLDVDRSGNKARLSEVVLIGHFHDRRARLCDAPKPACDSFVVDAVHAVDGVVQPPSTVVDLEPYETEPTPIARWGRADANGRALTLATSLDILSTIARPGHRIAELEPSLGTGALGIIDQPVIWLVNGLDHESDGTIRLRTLLLVDGTDSAYEAAPWDQSSVGFVPLAPIPTTE